MGAKEQAVAEAPSALEGLLAAHRTLAADDPLGALRREAWARFEELGFPGPNDEEWRQFPVQPLAGTAFVAAGDGAGAQAADLPAPIGRVRLVLLNGRLSAAHSTLDRLPAGLTLGNLSEALSGDGAARERLGTITPWRDRTFAALNTALFGDGAFVRVGPGTVLAEPLEIVHLAVPSDGRPEVHHPRVLVLVGEHAEATVVESFVSAGEGTYWTNAVTEIAVGENGRLDHVRIQEESASAFHVASVDARQERNSRYASHNIAFGSALARCDVGSRLDGAGAEAHLYGLTVAGDKAVIDHHTTLDHAVAHCPSHELYKSILWDRARYVFNGRIVVRPDAQKTDAKQSNRNLILSDDAVVYTRPQLEIYADDVRCTHGATIGRLDGEALFYLRARGLGAGEAKALLVRAFAGEVLEHVRHAGLRERLEEEAVRRIPSARKG